MGKARQHGFSKDRLQRIDRFLQEKYVGAGRMPLALITFDDGTLGWFYDAPPYLGANISEAFADATNPDERGMGFQVPWDCKTDAGWLDDLLRGISDGAPALATGATATFLNAVGLRASPARSSPKAAPKAAQPTQDPPADTRPEPVPDTRTAFQRLADKFR